MTKELPLDLVSKNFSFAKSAALLLVLLGHFDKLENLFGHFINEGSWILVTFGLCVFGFSSAYFTGKKYSNGNFTGYWKNKFTRLFVRVIVIQIFLFIFLFFSRGDSVFCWHSLVHFFGGTGFLNWFHIKDQSPMGNGLWFFTLLLIFYALYPFLISIHEKYYSIWIYMLLYILTFLLQSFFPMGHMLWLTAFAFLSGIFFAKTHNVLFVKLLMALSLLCMPTFLALNFLQIKSFNFIIISIISIGCCLYCIYFYFSFERFFRNAVSFINKHMLEIYFIHSYLYIYFFGNDFINIFSSFLLFASTAWILSKISSFFQNIIEKKIRNAPCIRA
ncbi:MAG: acyltransferase family protein [Desulfobulbus sp.]|jgi:hypothetical protein